MVFLFGPGTRHVFADVAKQASVTLSPMPPELWDMRPMPKVTLDVEGQPFWRVMRMLAEQTGVELRAWSDGQPRLVLGGGGGLNASQRWIVSGPFLIALVRCARTHSVDYAAGDALSSEFGISFVATAEPKLHVSRAAYFAHLDEATDDRGHSLIPTDNANEPARFFDAPGAALAGSSGSWQFNARLSYPTDMGSKLTTLRGSVGAMLQTKFETIEIGDLMSAQNVQRSAGGVTVTIESVKKNGDRYDLAMKVSREAAINVGVELERMQQSFSDIRLLDANGRPLFRTGFSSSGIGAAANGSVQEIAATMSFMAGETPLAGPDRRVSEPSKFVWKIATESKELTIPFEFKDVPLPQ
jgi:hypothetical protein